MTLDSQHLKKIADLTLEHYNQRATAFWEGTRHHNVTPNIAILLQYSEGQAPFTILDFGCGPGRDRKVFFELGHIAVGLDGTARFVDMARAHSGCEVWQQDFCKLDLPDKQFDGSFANASLFHLPSQELARVLLELHATLKTGACCSAQTRTVITKKVGPAGAMAHITIFKSCLSGVFDVFKSNR